MWSVFFILQCVRGRQYFLKAKGAKITLNFLCKERRPVITLESVSCLHEQDFGTCEMSRTFIFDVVEVLLHLSLWFTAFRVISKNNNNNNLLHSWEHLELKDFKKSLLIFFCNASGSEKRYYNQSVLRY